MAKATFIQEGKIINFTAQREIAYNEIVPIGNCVGVATESIRAGSTGGVRMTGVYEMPAAAETMEVGDTLYWDNDNNYVTKTKGELTCIAGIAVSKKAGSGAGTVYCRIG